MSRFGDFKIWQTLPIKIHNNVHIIFFSALKLFRKKKKNNQIINTIL